MPALLLEEFQKFQNNDVEPIDPAKKILFAILNDIFGRKGFDDVWDDVNSSLREDLLDVNLRIVKKNLSS